MLLLWTQQSCHLPERPLVGTGAQVKLPVKRVTACTFGGPGLEQLFVTTRVESFDGASEHWGSVLSVRVPQVAGAAGAYPVKLPAGKSLSA
jgi:sugar lactone lactonase YvrE